MRRATPILIADRDELLNDFTTAAVAASAQPDRPHGPGRQDSASVPTAAGPTEDMPASAGDTGPISARYAERILHRWLR